MICFEIFINGNKACTAGVDSKYGVLSSILTWVKRDLNNFSSSTRDKIPSEELDLNVSGQISRSQNDYENLDWIKERLSIGDEIKIRIIESSKVDPPSKRQQSDPDFLKKQKRKYYENLKKEYGED